MRKAENQPQSSQERLRLRGEPLHSLLLRFVLSGEKPERVTDGLIVIDRSTHVLQLRIQCSRKSLINKNPKPVDQKATHECIAF